MPLDAWGHWTPAREKKIKTLHLMQASMQFNDTLGALEKDLEYIYAQGPDVVGYTEIQTPELRHRWAKVTRAAGYHPYTPHNAATPLAVKLGGDAQTQFKSQGGIKVFEGVAKKYPARYITWVKIRWWDQNIWVHEAHWNRLKWGADRHTPITAQMAAQVKKHGQGDSISFFMGDLNIDEGHDNRTNARNMPNFIFRQNGLLTIFDEFNTLPPPTIGHSVFDVIGSYRPDQQVKGARYKVHPKKRSDHSFVSAWYDIDVAKKASTGVPTALGFISTTHGWGSLAVWPGNNNSAGGGSGDSNGPSEPIDPDFYATGGSVSWADYLDDDLYPLPYAVRDSDSHRHG